MISKTSFVRGVGIVCLLLLRGISCFAQSAPVELSSPYDAVWTHLYYLQEEQYDAGVSALAFPVEDSVSAKKAAIQLKQIYDGKGLYVHINLLPQDQDYRDTVTDAQYYTPFPEALPQIYLEKNEDKWGYSIESIAQIPELHKAVYPYGTSRLVHYFSNRGQGKFLGISAWQFLGLGFLLVFALVANLILTTFSRLLLSQVGNRKFADVDEFPVLRSKLARIFSAGVVIWLLRTFIPILQLSPNFNIGAILICRVIISLFVAWFFLTLLSLFMAYLNRAATATDNRMDDQIIPILHRLLQIVIVTVAILQILNLLDVNITALIAGVSIGGLAIALAAQDSVKNLIGSVMIFIDRPFQIGDWVEGSDFAGTVVEVGFRSTRIKTTDTSIISVPNGRMADATVKNMGVREFRLFSASLGITYDTPTQVIERFLQGLKEIIAIHPKVSNEGWYVNLTGMSDSSLDILVRAYMEVPDYASELQVRESLYLGILQWAENLGVSFAFPTQTLYMENSDEQGAVRSEADLDERWLAFLSGFESSLSPFTSEQKIS